MKNSGRTDYYKYKGRSCQTAGEMNIHTQIL